MATISRGTKASGGTAFTDGTTAYGSEVETDFATVYAAWNAHDAGTSSWTTLKVTGTSPADAQLTLAVTGVETFSLGVDTSASAFKISNSTALGTDDFLIINTNGYIALGTSATIAGIFSITDGSTSDMRVSIYKNNATGDPYINFATNATNWSFGVDNSASDALKICLANGIGTTDYMVIDTSGNVAFGPSSAIAGMFSITDTGTSDIRCVVYKNNATGDPYWNLATNATNWSIGIDNSDTDALVITMANTLNGTNYFKIDTNGQVQLGNGTGAANVMINSATTTGSATATMTNAPVAGNPTGWLAINVNGTARNIPYWPQS